MSFIRTVDGGFVNLAHIRRVVRVPGEPDQWCALTTDGNVTFECPETEIAMVLNVEQDIAEVLLSIQVAVEGLRARLEEITPENYLRTLDVGRSL